MAKQIWKVDPAHSEILFKVRHMVISTVTGKFEKFDGTVETEDDRIDTAKVEFTIDTASVNTGVPDRDNHLRSDDFFNAQQFPQIRFVSTAFKKINDQQYRLEGNLTIRDITKLVELNVEYGGMVKDPWGNTRAGFVVTGKINRKDFGLKWNALLETGGAVVSDEVQVQCAVEFTHS
ncbi:MAG: YceI family protein [Thermoflavifilum sp.]|nr:YceI family protein [Thermoflavifilum sp.]